MEFLQVVTCTGPKFIYVATSTSCLYKLQLVQNLNLYITYCCNSPVTVCSIPLLWTLGGTLMIQTSFINVFLFICFFSTQLSVHLIFLCNYIVFVIWRHFKLYLSIRLLDLSLSRRPSPFIFAFASGYSNGEIVSARDSLHSPPSTRSLVS